MQNSLGVKLEISDHILLTSPCCVHGPTVIYERQSKNGSSKRYYACSAIRDRKICPFYKLCSDSFTKSNVINNQKSPRFKYIGDDFFKLNVQKMYFCQSCELLFRKDHIEKYNDHIGKSKSKKRKLNMEEYIEISKDHELHDVICCGETINQPTLFMNPLNNKKTNAQYFYSDESCKYICDMITYKTTHILFLATPRLFEFYRLNYSSLSPKTILLMDFDDRFAQFYPKKLFCKFNLFNFYFYNDDEANCIYKDFLSSAFDKDNCGGNILVIIDPPFNAMVKQLMFSLNRIARDFFTNKSNNSSDINSNYLPTILTFPMYMCPRIQAYNEDIKILDFPITYTNHPKFSHKKSTIRIYTINSSNFQS